VSRWCAPAASSAAERATRLIALTAAALLACSCAPLATSHPAPAKNPVAAERTAALDDMFSNHYTAADSAFAGLLAAAPGDADVHADFALFLQYRGDTDIANAQSAAAISLAPHDGHAAAVRTRVLDWAGGYAAAAGEARIALRLAPGDPLAHLFAAEALADNGDLAGGAAQIAQAAALVELHPTPYLRAEIDREQANLDGDSGKPEQRITDLQRALAAQPGWVYRTTELVDALFAAGQTAQARAAIDAAARSLPDDVQSLQLLGNDALSAGDGPAALTMWRRAAQLAPNLAAIDDMNGEVDVAVANDTAAAIAEFEAALRADRSDLSAAGYLMGIESFIDHDPAAGVQEIRDAWSAGLPRSGGDHVQPPLDPQAAWERDAQRALALVNATRAQAGVPPVTLDSRLSASAESHSYYWLFNNLAPSVAGLGIHQETRGLLGFSGTWPWTRAPMFGYPNSNLGEDITHRAATGDAIGDWVNSVFHRFAILRPDLLHIGYGDASIGSILMNDMEFGFGPATDAAPVLYPASGQGSVPATFYDNELPDPVPAGAPRTTGYPVTVTFSYAYRVSLRGFTLAASGGAPLAAYVLAPSSETENSASLLPAAPLAPRTTYVATIAAVINGVPFTRRWSFTTA